MILDPRSVPSLGLNRSVWQGGILGNESHLEFAHETLRHGDVAYIPNGRAYWFREAHWEEERGDHQRLQRGPRGLI